MAPVMSINRTTLELLDILPAAIYTCDLEGRVTFYNQAAATLWGRTPELYKDLWCGSFKIFSKNGEQIALDDCPMAQVLKMKIPVKSQEIVVERPDGIREASGEGPRAWGMEVGASVRCIATCLGKVAGAKWERREKCERRENLTERGASIGQQTPTRMQAGGFRPQWAVRRSGRGGRRIDGRAVVFLCGAARWRPAGRRGVWERASCVGHGGRGEGAVNCYVFGEGGGCKVGEARKM
jgi:PAS domain-containing protein